MANSLPRRGAFMFALAVCLSLALASEGCKRRRRTDAGTAVTPIVPVQQYPQQQYAGQYPQQQYAGQYPQQQYAGQYPQQPVQPMQPMDPSAQLAVPPPVATAPDNGMPIPPPGVMRQIPNSGM